MLGDVYHGELVPTDYSLRMRPYFIFMLGLIGCYVMAKLIIHDYWGATSLLILVLCGIFVIVGQYAFNATAALFFGAMSLMTAVFDLVSLVLYMHFAKHRIFDLVKTPLHVLLAQAILVSCPVLLVGTACMAISMFRDCRDNSEELSPFQQPSATYTNQAFGPIQPIRSSCAEPVSSKAFQGVGRKLRDL
mmetsp:Transcript_76699/g.135327  ORF Transcript_76699/g.135327 Transcript_76699/m.135327 type:complete len:190 (+) Transcript_76699:143-712(+)|eukprot:CAMPEP_0197653820 /NCGR_PEP_ID=MMETSP1338-20131121/37306_1 /TAXON_ID=43686 ORGANISM="Pelagodinium beii, Strain RCC1491" /NCGR_SAMPLE_ID=MMETSP1338 /ASSEMBLY_ACC=CAM_ASM_000754 /LENGTH=189 /DNA_ID=CAMNT_0043229075 /DNA_START=143 /DNA_END=712 /DNA_ORIENTATION=-